MGVTRDGGHTRYPEVEGSQGETSLLHERQQEAAETAIHVQANLALPGDDGESLDVVDHAVRELRRRANNGNGVACHSTAHLCQIGLAGLFVHRYVNDFDTEIIASLVESAVDRGRNN